MDCPTCHLDPGAAEICPYCGTDLRLAEVEQLRQALKEALAIADEAINIAEED